MREFKCDLYERREKAEWHRRRYWTHPETRLRRINKSRERLGLAPYERLDDVPTRSERANQIRGESGRFA